MTWRAQQLHPTIRLRCMLVHMVHAQAIEVGLSAPALYGRQTRRGNVIFDGGPHEWTEETEF